MGCWLRHCPERGPEEALQPPRWPRWHHRVSEEMSERVNIPGTRREETLPGLADGVSPFHQDLA